MKLNSITAAVALAAALPMAALAQNVAIVNGKPVPTARVTALMEQASRAGQPIPPEMETRAKDEVVMREIFAQEAMRQGVAASPEYQTQLELARETLLIRELFAKYQKAHPATDAEVKAEYDKLKAQNSGDEYRARHILVETEEEAKKLIAEIKAGASFEELAKKHSKDPGSGANGGDLDFNRPETFVPEFSKAMTSLKKGEMTQAPVKTQFGWHIIKLEDTRPVAFPPLAEVEPQVKQRLAQTKLQAYQDELRKAAKTDYKWSDAATAK